jgi:hypothetical protein
LVRQDHGLDAASLAEELEHVDAGSVAGVGAEGD